jgi:hypothetical protein
MTPAQQKELFLLYMKDVNHIDDIEPRRAFRVGKLEKWLAVIILSCLGIMTAWELMKEIIMKLRF